jgi:hypothetical protein
MNKEYEFVYAVIRADEYRGADKPVERKVTVKEIVWDEETARREVERLNALRKEGVHYFSQVTRLLQKKTAPQIATNGSMDDALDFVPTSAEQRERIVPGP